MLLRQREAGSMLDRVASRSLGIGCAAFLLAQHLPRRANLLATPGKPSPTQSALRQLFSARPYSIDTAPLEMGEAPICID
jgi:hypothetical protein